MIRTAFPLAACAALALAACAEDPSTVAGTDETDLDNVDTESEREAAAAALEAGDFANLELGAKIVGPQGPEVKTTLSNEAGIFADITSYVACPAGMSTCDPATAPRGTVYTYVHIVYPGEDNDPTTGFVRCRTRHAVPHDPPGHRIHGHRRVCQGRGARGDRREGGYRDHLRRRRARMDDLGR